MSNPLEVMVNQLDTDKKEKAIELLRNFENLRVQFAKEIKERSDVIVANKKIQDDLDDSPEEREKIKQNTEKLLMEKQEVDQKLQQDKDNKDLLARQTEILEDIELIKQDAVKINEKHEKLKQSLDQNLQSLQKLDEKLKPFEEAKKNANSLLNSLSIKGNIESHDISFALNIISTKDTKEKPLEKNWKTEKHWSEKNTQKASYFKPPEQMQTFLKKKGISVCLTGETWACKDDKLPDTSYHIDDGKVTTTGKTDAAFCKAIEILIEGERIKNGGIKPDLSTMKLTVTGPDKDKILKIAKETYGIGKTLDNKEIAQNTVGRSPPTKGEPPKKDDQPPPSFTPFG